jgi:iron complex outermembrane receptor protein
VPFNSVSNAARATIKGVEAELSVVPVRGFTLSGSTGYIDAAYDSYLRRNVVTGVVTDLSSRRFPDTPKWTYSVSGDLSQPLGAGTINLHADWSWRASAFFDVDNTAFAYQRKYGLLGARIAYSTSLGRGPLHDVEFALWGKNLTNERYNSYATVVGATRTGVLRSDEPRSYGVSVRTRF